MPSKSARKKSGLPRQRGGWKEVQSKNKKARRIKLALVVLLLIIGFLITTWVIRLTQQSLFSPWKVIAGYQRNYTWDARFNINLLVRGKSISVLTYSPKQNSVIIINIPNETFLEVPSGFGLWQLRSVYELGESQKTSSGDKLLKDTLTSFLALPIDGFLDLSNLPNKSAVDMVNILKKNPFSGWNLLFSLKTDLTVWELLRLKLGLGGVRFDKIKELNLVELGVLEEESLPDGTKVKTSDPIKLDSVLSDFADPAIASEHSSIAVLNATDYPQLAQKAARLITNLGGNVIIMANADQKIKKTRVQGVESATLKRLKQIFEIDKTDSREAATGSRAQINLLLGEDYVNKIR